MLTFPKGPLCLIILYYIFLSLGERERPLLWFWREIVLTLIEESEIFSTLDVELGGVVCVCDFFFCLNQNQNKKYFCLMWKSVLWPETKSVEKQILFHSTIKFTCLVYFGLFLTKSPSPTILHILLMSCWIAQRTSYEQILTPSLLQIVQQLDVLLTDMGICALDVCCSSRVTIRVWPGLLVLVDRHVSCKLCHNPSSLDDS